MPERTTRQTRTRQARRSTIDPSRSQAERRVAPIVHVGTTTIRVEPGTPFLEEIKKIARDNGIKKFRLMVAEVEISVDETPEVFEPGQEIRVIPHDVPRGT